MEDEEFETEQLFAEVSRIASRTSTSTAPSDPLYHDDNLSSLNPNAQVSSGNRNPPHGKSRGRQDSDIVREFRPYKRKTESVDVTASDLQPSSNLVEGDSTSFPTKSKKAKSQQESSVDTASTDAYGRRKFTAKSQQASNPTLNTVKQKLSSRCLSVYAL